MSFRLLRSVPALRRALYSTHHHHHPHAHHGSRRRASAWALAGGLTAVGSVTAYLMGSLYPIQALTIISPRVAPPPLPADHPDAIARTAALEDELQELAPLKQMRLDQDADEWYETRPYVTVPEERRVNHLTAGALRGPGRLALPPLVRARTDESEAVVFLHLGRGLCGHDGIVHGGLLATLLDESMGRVAIMNLPEKVGVTATLTVNYKAPTIADQWVVIRIELVSSHGRKAHVSSTVKALDGTTLVEANALFVQPKYAGVLLDRKALKQALGEPVRPGTKLVIEGGARHIERDVSVHP